MKVEVSIDGFISKQRIVCLGALTALFSITIISGGILSSSIVTATDDSVVDEINITVPISCTLTGTGMNTHNAEIANGTYTVDIGTTTLKAYCNDNNGFAIYAAGYTGNEIGGTNSNKLVGTSASSNATIETGTATSAGNPDVSNWAMKLTTVSDPTPTYPITLDNGFGSYSAVPNSYTKVAHRDSSTDIGTNAEGATLTTTYAAYISKTQPADTYSGQVIYILIHPSDAEPPLSPQPATAGCINYFANASTAVGTMGCQSATDGSSKTLLASNFSRTGYGFAGWSDKYDYATNTNAHFYGPQETITVPDGTTTNGLSLYAVWVPSAGSLQDSSKVSQLCGTGTGSLTTAPTDGTANLSSVSALTDQRDNQTYAIAKLADGKCWMIENLRLENTNSDNSTGALAQGYGTSATYGDFGGLANAEFDNFSNITTANSLYYSDVQSGTASINVGATNNPGYRIPRYNNTNTSNRASSPNANNQAMYSYGNYYTWSAVIANTVHYNSPTAQDTNGKTSETVNTSLCPAGWRLPYGRSSGNGNTVGGFSYLDTQLGGTGVYQMTNAASLRWRIFPNNYINSGNYDTSSAVNRGTYGRYWSSTAYDNDNSFALNISNALIIPGTTGYSKNLGFSIRCTVSADT